MANVIFHSYTIPSITGIPRSSPIPLQLPPGTIACGVLQLQGEARLVVRGDTAQVPFVTRNFLMVRDDVPQTTEEAAGQYVGSFTGCRTDLGLEVYHVIAL